MLTPVSLRDFIFQNSLIIRDREGAPVGGQTPIYQSQVQGSDQTASDLAWKAFLRDSYSTANGQLQFTFALSLDRPGIANTFEDDIRRRRANPFFDPTEFGTLSTYLEGRPSAFGLRINIKARGLSGPGNQPIKVTLQQEGASYIRDRAWKDDRDGRSIQLWNLGRTVSANVQASFNGLPEGLVNPQFHERSPANDRWVLTIPSGSPANNYLLSNLTNISDIEVQFSLSSEPNAAMQSAQIRK